MKDMQSKRATAKSNAVDVGNKNGQGRIVQRAIRITLSHNARKALNSPQVMVEPRKFFDGLAGP